MLCPRWLRSCLRGSPRHLVTLYPTCPAPCSRGPSPCSPATVPRAVLPQASLLFTRLLALPPACPPSPTLPLHAFTLSPRPTQCSYGLRSCSSGSCVFLLPLQYCPTFCPLSSPPALSAQPFPLARPMQCPRGLRSCSRGSCAPQPPPSFPHVRLYLHHGSSTRRPSDWETRGSLWPPCRLLRTPPQTLRSRDSTCPSGLSHLT